MFDDHTRACFYDIRYEWWDRQRGWFIIIAPLAGGGGVQIQHCPHCGAELSRPAPEARP